MEHRYEVHIVGYLKTRLDELPSGFHKFTITDSQVALSEISTAETESFDHALKSFNSAVGWVSNQKRAQMLHVKFEELLGNNFINSPNLSVNFSEIKYPILPPTLSYDENLFVGAFGWDVHVDGRFDYTLRKDLVSKGWIYLDYLSPQGEKYTTLTQHFLERKKCEKVYNGILHYIKLIGGFNGQIYWERPVRYLVSET